MISEIKYVTNPSVLTLYDQNMINELRVIYEEIREQAKTLKLVDKEFRNIMVKSTKYKKPIVPENYFVNYKYDPYCNYAHYIITKTDYLNKIIDTVKKYYPEDTSLENIIDLGVVIIASMIRNKMSNNK
ncbi:MAG: hypothetical protein QXF12_04045 [Candidatus Aenigmatarchaeota archaeon]